MTELEQLMQQAEELHESAKKFWESVRRSSGDALVIEAWNAKEATWQVVSAVNKQIVGWKGI